MKLLKTIALLLLAVLLTLSLSGCRHRITRQVGESEYLEQLEDGSGNGMKTGLNSSGLSGNQTVIDSALPPEKRFDARIDPAADGEIGMMSDALKSGDNARTDETEENRVTMDEISYEGGETRPSDEGGTVGTIMDANTELLCQGLGTLYECQIVYVYLELSTEYQTVNRHGEEHQVILDSGGYNVAEKRGDDNLIIDDGWILRKNPGVIIKCVDKNVLGAGIHDTSAANALYDRITARPGWGNVSAILNKKLLLLSDTLFETAEGRFIAKLYIAKEMYPALFEELNVDAVCEQLMEAAFGEEAIGIYAYR